jgi:hypothetical protein
VCCVGVCICDIVCVVSICMSLLCWTVIPTRVVPSTIYVVAVVFVFYDIFLTVAGKGHGSRGRSQSRPSVRRVS